MVLTGKSTSCGSGKSGDAVAPGFRVSKINSYMSYKHRNMYMHVHYTQTHHLQHAHGYSHSSLEKPPALGQMRLEIETLLISDSSLSLELNVLL